MCAGVCCVLCAVDGAWLALQAKDAVCEKTRRPRPTFGATAMHRGSHAQGAVNDAASTQKT